MPEVRSITDHGARRALSALAHNRDLSAVTMHALMGGADFGITVTKLPHTRSTGEVVWWLSCSVSRFNKADGGMLEQEPSWAEVRRFFVVAHTDPAGAMVEAGLLLYREARAAIAAKQSA